ncbi:MAG: DsrE family protein [Xanthobacteraceae bacterium]|nr:DsrE family protein [Xanthobacteraceae bacterium]
MHRRGILAAVMTAAGGLFAASAKSAQASPAPDKTKVVYHLTDLDKVAFVLGNIKNHYEGVGGPANVTISLVVHGPALKGFHAATAGPETTRRVADFSRAGLQLNVCGNTMRAQEVTLKDLLPGFVVAEDGGVVRIAELQSQGYVYIRP